jgi:diguanylate cyclase (GGDEF)-like protein
MAFGAVAGTTLFVTFIALATYSNSGAAIDRIAEQQVPAVIALSRLAQQSNMLLASAPSLMFANSEAEFRSRASLLDSAEQTFLDAHAGIGEATGHLSSQTVEEVDETAARISGQMLFLRSATERQWWLAGKEQDLVARARALDQQAHQNADATGAGPGQAIRHLAEVDRLSRLIEAVPKVDRANLTFFQSQVEEGVRSLRADNSGLSEAFTALALAPDGIIGLRTRQLDAAAVAEDRIGDLRVLSKSLHDMVSSLVTDWLDDVRRDREAARATISVSKIALGTASGVSILAALLIAWLYVGRNLLRRIALIDGSMRAIAGGVLTAPIPTGGHDEVAQMAKSLTVFRDAMAEVAHLAEHDSLTGLGNRNKFEARVRHHMECDDRMAVLYLNLSGFKGINDTFGHAVGDLVLVEMADRLKKVTRPEDTLACFGGDDFAVLMPGLDGDSVMSPARQIEAAMDAPIRMDALSIEMHAAVGIACFPANGVTPAVLLDHADMAMNEARAEGGSIRLFDDVMGAAAANRKTIRAELRQAIDAQQMHLLYQPKVNMATGEVVGMEALVRWDHPQRGRIGPAEFVPIAEQSGIIVPLGDWVLREASRQTKAWLDEGLRLRVAVNFSPVQFLRQDVVGAVEQALESTGLPPEFLEIEITEGVFMREESKVMYRLDDLRSRGIHLAIDDFGTGYSSLNYLKRLPVDCLKIDQSFVREMFRSDDNARIARAIIGIAHDFNLEVVAEGIETKRQADFLRAENCDLGQGYYFGRPLEPDDFYALLRNSQAGAPSP